MIDNEMLSIAVSEAKLGLSEGGIPIGAALFDGNGRLLGPDFVAPQKKGPHPPIDLKRIAAFASSASNRLQI